MTGRVRNHHAARRCAGVAITLLLSACAHEPPPRAELDAADSAIARARAERAADFAPLEFGFAEQKQGEARAAFSAKKYAEAQRLAEQALVDAQLAAAKSRAAKVRSELHRRSGDNETLRRELLGTGATR